MNRKQLALASIASLAMWLLLLFVILSGVGWLDHATPPSGPGFLPPARSGAPPVLLHASPTLAAPATAKAAERTTAPTPATQPAASPGSSLPATDTQ